MLLRFPDFSSCATSRSIVCNCVYVLFSSDLVDISRYSPLFNSHLQVCMDRQILPVASDTVDFMLLKNLAVDQVVLQILLHKLGKQNLWLRAREVFRRKYHLLIYRLHHLGS